MYKSNCMKTGSRIRLEIPVAICIAMKMTRRTPIMYEMMSDGVCKLTNVDILIDTHPSRRSE